MPGENEQVADLEGQVTELEKRIKELTDAGKGDDELAKALEFQKTALAKLEEVSDALETSLIEKEGLMAELKMTKAMSDDEKEYCKDMGPEEKSTFMSKSPEDRKAEMKKSLEDDEVVTISGRKIRKSVVGDDAFEIMKDQAEKLAKNEKTINEEIAKREMTELLKRADDEFSHVPGTVEERAKMLQAIGKMDEPLRKSFETVLTQSEKLTKAGFEKLGVSDGGKRSETGERDVQKAITDFETKVAEIKKRDSCTSTEASARARKAFPELYKAYQEASS